MAARPKILALSGGADDGAFGAGLLVGWTGRGDRPEFDVVTGVSAGALIAPIAFLGSERDAVLADAFTNFDLDSIAAPRGVLGLLDNSLYDTSPLRKLIAEIIDEEIVDDIAEAHLEGRRLFVVTTDLDREAAIVWNMGAIAALDDPNRIALFHDVLLASSSVPGLFPPVEIEVKNQEARLTELHLDGGAAIEFLAVPEVFLRQDVWPHGSPEGAELYVVVNNRLAARPEVVAGRLGGIVQRSLSTLIRSFERQSADRILAFARRTGVAARVAAIDPKWRVAREDWFDPTYMRAVFAHGRELGRTGVGWHKELRPLVEVSRRSDLLGPVSAKRIGIRLRPRLRRGHELRGSGDARAAETVCFDRTPTQSARASLCSR
ncbi:MAG: patatin-like phospholipase family protein [Pseudomonadota bacterium]